VWGKCRGSGVGLGAPNRLGAVYSVGAGVFHWFSTGHKKTPQFVGGVRASVCGSFYTFALCQENKAKLGIF
jgi:hypothetical protein